MENVITQITKLFSTYGFTAGLIIVLTIVIVNVIKKPIITRAVAYAEKSGYDKAVVTKNIVYLPIGISFILTFIFALFSVNFVIAKISWGAISAEATVYAAASIATYETIKKHLEAYASKKNSPSKVLPNESKKEGDKNEEILQ